MRYSGMDIPHFSDCPNEKDVLHMHIFECTTCWDRPDESQNELILESLALVDIQSDRFCFVREESQVL